MMSHRCRAELRLARSRSRSRSSCGRLLRPLMPVGLLGLSLFLMSCGSSTPLKSYQQGWDRAVRSLGDDCNAVPRGITSHSDWTKGCRTAQGFQGIHATTGHYPTSTPTTYPGDP